MSTCSDLVFLSMLSCDLGECLSIDELLILSKNLTTLSHMISTIALEKELAKKKLANQELPVEEVPNTEVPNKA